MRNIVKNLVSLATLCVIACSCSNTACAQNSKEEKPYNLQKAWEVLQENQDEAQAVKLLDEQLKSTPDNVECWMLLCRIHKNREEFGSALTDVNEAIKVNKPRKSGFFNSTLWWWKGTVYDEMGDDAAAVNCLTKSLEMARKDNKSNVQDISFDLAQCLYDLKRYDESDAIYKQMVEDDEADQAAMTGLARNMIVRKDYSGAVAILDKAEKFDSDYASVYKFRGQAYDKLGETDKAIDDALTWFEKDDDAYGNAIVKLMMKHKSYALANAKTRMKESENKSRWRILMIGIYEAAWEFENAISEYDILEEEYGKDEYIYYNRADSYSELGLADKALSEIDKAIALENDYYNNCRKGQILRTEGKYADAIKSFDAAIEITPTEAFAYYAKGWCYELSGDDTKAREFYDKGIDMDKDYPYIYLMRGQIYLKRGEDAAAKSDFEKVLQIDTTVTDGSCRQYALMFLGQETEAEAWMQKLIDDELYNAGHYYDKACLCSRMGKFDEAMKAFETCLKMGYCKFAHVEHDDDLDAIRNREDFRTLVKQYKAKLNERIAIMKQREDSDKEGQITEVAISRHHGGTFNVDCSVNGLDLNMIFDTGASDVTISKVEADFMLKNDYLSREDIKGKKFYQVADGGIAEGTVVTLKELKIGDAVLHNVDASVVKSQKAPLLLGQSAMERFGTITIDNINSKLIIKH